MGRLLTAVRTRGSLGLGRAPGRVRRAPGGFSGLPASATRATDAGLVNSPDVPATPHPIGDSQSVAATLDAAQARNRGLASVYQRAGDLQGEFGYNITGGENNDNPFNRRLMLQRAYATQRNVTGQSMGAAGQLYSGALENQNASDRFSNSQQQDALLRQFNASRDALAQEGGNIGGAYNTAVNVTIPGEFITRHANDPAPDPGAGYDVYRAQAQQNNASPLGMDRWTARGNPQTTLTGRGAFGGGRLAGQFNALNGPDQGAYQRYLASSARAGRRALLPSQWIAAGRPA